MTKTYFYLDKRKPDKRGRHQIKVGISKNRKTAFIPTGIWIFEENWNSESEIAVGYEGSKQDNILLLSVMSKVMEVISDLRLSGRIVGMDCKEIKYAVLEKIEPERVPKKKVILFAETFEKFMMSKKKEGTRTTYRTTWNHLHRFDPKVDEKTFEEIDLVWLNKFESYLSQSANKNARNVNLRNIRAVFNHALDEEITTFYPFRKFKIRPQETAHRALTVEQVRTLRDCTCDPHQVKYRDMFMLMVYMVGVNAVDLFTPNHGRIRSGRFEFFRMKTQKEGSAGKFFSIKIEPEAKELFDKYYDYKKGVFSFMRNRADYKSFLQKMSRELKRLGPYERKGLGGKKIYKSLFPEISQYWSRHTWATLAAELDVPENTISFALGHDIRNSTTAIYIKFNQKKVDAANRLVIDFINEK